MNAQTRFCDINLAINGRVGDTEKYTEDDPISMGGRYLVSGKDSSSLSLERPNVMRLQIASLFYGKIVDRPFYRPRLVL